MNAKKPVKKLVLELRRQEVDDIISALHHTMKDESITDAPQFKKALEIISRKLWAVIKK